MTHISWRWTFALALYINFVIFDGVQIHLNMDNIIND